MAHTIHLFMWGFQSHFRIGAKVWAEGLFRALDPALDPDVLLVGRIEKKREDRHPLCVDPEDGEILLDALSGLDGHVAAATADDPESRMLQSHPVAEGYRQERVTRNAFANGVARALNQSRLDRRFFASYPQLVDDYLVTTILHVDRIAYQRHPALVHREYLNRFTVSTSLLDAAVRIFLGECSDALRDPSPGEGPLPIRPTEDLLREAGRMFMDNPANRLGEVPGYPQLFDRFCEVAALRYEGTEGRGRVLITAASRAGVDVTLSFAEPVPIRAARAARKLLEMASENLDLLATPQGFYGLGRAHPGHNPDSEDVFAVVFLERNAWELRHAGRSLMRVQDGIPAPPREPLGQDSFAFTARRLFSDGAEVDLDRLWNAVAAAREQKHGTVLVFSSGAEAEAQRLAAQSTVVQPVPLTTELVASVTAVDGAVLADPLGICHAIGVILDGMVVATGDRGRGARYNSVLRYVETARTQFGHKVLAFIVSEDGTVDFLPALRPQIRRCEIDARLNTLRRSAEEPSPSRTVFLRAVDWLREHSFYLDISACEEATKLVGAFEAASRAKSQGAVQVNWPPFEPHPEFEESYVLDD